MTSPTQAQLETARRLLSHERPEGGGSGEGAEAAGRVFEKLFLRLLPLLGSASFRVLFGRSVRLTRARFSFLEAVATEPAESQGQRLRDCLRDRGEDEATEAAVALIAA